jgi:PPP family 3-phenylpropionic acid transporter
MKELSPSGNENRHACRADRRAGHPWQKKHKREALPMAGVAQTNESPIPTGKTTVRDVVMRSFSFTNYMTNAIILSVFPIYFHLLGFSKTQSGLLYAIGPAVGIAANLIWGVTSDRFQTIKKVILVLLTGQLAMMLTLFQFETFPVIFIVILIFYFFQTPVNGLNDSQTLLYAAKTGKSYASFRVMGSFGFAVAAVSFGYIIRVPDKLSIAVLSICTIAVTLAISLGLKDDRESGKKMGFSGLFQVLMSRKVLVFFVLLFLLALAARVNDSFLSLYLIELGADPSIVGISWMVSALSEIPIFFLLGRYGNRMHELPLLGIGAVFYALRFLIMSLPLEPHWIIVTQAMHSVSFGIFLITAIRYMQALIPDQYRATGQALFNVVWGGMAGLVSGAAGGKVFDLWGGQTLYFIAALLAAAAAAGFFSAHIAERRNG